MSAPKLAFLMEAVRLPLSAILPVRIVKDPVVRFKRYGSILASIKSVGQIEPLMVYPQKGKFGMYLLVDGHLRLCALKELGHTEADCLISTEDESFTYNARINRLSPIQEHRMIAKAVQSGVDPGKIAEALNMKLKDVRVLIDLLNGIHPDAAELLKDKPISTPAIALLKKACGIRQIEIAELLVSLKNFTFSYVEGLILGTPKSQLVKPNEPKVKKGLSAEEIVRMESEMESIQHDFRAIEQSYGEEVLNLTVTRSYVKKLLENAKIKRFLSAKYQDLHSEFETIVALEGI